MKRLLSFLAILMMVVTASASDVVFDTNDTWSEDYSTNTISCTKDGITLTIAGSQFPVRAKKNRYFDFGPEGTATITVNAGTATVTGITVAGEQEFYNFDLTGAGPWTCPIEAGRLKNGSSVPFQVMSFTVHFEGGSSNEIKLTNGDFADGVIGDVNIATYANDGTPNQMQEVPGWSFGVENADARAAGVVAYGSATTFGGSQYGVPAAGPEGTNGKALGMVAVWTGTVQYVQNVLLPAGKYTLTALVYNTSGTTAFAKNLIGVKYGETENFATAKNYPVGEWTNETIDFELAENTEVTVSVGYEGANVGGGASQHLFIDCVKIEPYVAPTHKHDYATAWSTDETNHWHACNGGEDCDAPKSDEAAHSYGEVATETAYYTCSVCEYVNTTRQAEYWEANTIDLTFDNTTTPSFEYYPESGDWYLGWADNASTYIVRLDYLAPATGKFGHYTINDLDLGYSYLSDYSSGSRVDYMYTDADFTITDEGNYSFSLTGRVVCTNNKIYNLSGFYTDHKAIVADVVEKINAIGTVGHNGASKYLIDEARAAYDALTDAQKALITEEQYKVLTDAEKAYEDMTPVWGEWSHTTTASYNYDLYWSGRLSNLTVNVRYATNVDNIAQVEVQEWGATPCNFTFEWNTLTNTCYVPAQIVTENSTYGDVTCSDIPTWQDLHWPAFYKGFPCSYDPETMTFTFNLSYYVSLGSFGYGEETLVFDAPLRSYAEVIADIISDLTATIEEAKAQLGNTTSKLGIRILNEAIAKAEQFAAAATINTTAEDVAEAVAALRADMDRAGDYDYVHTDITSLVAAKNSGVKIFNISGRLVNQFKRGEVYIMNGKKYIVVND